MAKTALLIVFEFVSILIGVLFLLHAVSLYRKGGRARRVLSSVHVCTIGIFLSVLLLFIPIYYTDYDFGDTKKYIRPFLLALHNSIRIFLIDGDFDIIVESVKDQAEPLRICFSGYAALLYVFAPILTFTNVMSLFRNLRGELRFMLHRRKKHYIMSELNEKSIALAKSIIKRDKKAVIVFAEVFEQNEEDDYELLTEARDMDAICLKRDIAQMNLLSKKGTVEIFLIGNNESENVSQAVKITNVLNQKNSKQNVKIFVFSSKPSAAYIIDSIRYDNLLQYASDMDFNDQCFKLRRIDERKQLIWNTVPKMRLFELADRHNQMLSVLVVGFGSYGMEFFKMLVWYCQFEGYRLRINIVDKCGKSTADRESIESRIRRDCPELLKTNGKVADGEAYYDIQVFSGIDAVASDLDELLLYDGADRTRVAASQRLRGTNLVFVSLGDDDTNVEVSIHLRNLFDRLNGVQADENIAMSNETVDIYSVVYDEHKSGILHSEGGALTENNSLVNYCNTPFNIHFIGSMPEQFDYGNIYDADLEKCGLAHHLGWVEIEERIYIEQKNEKKLKELEKSKTAEAKISNRKRYEKFEYYRYSSISKELYQREIRCMPSLLSRTLCLAEEKLQTCTCENCVRRKKSEHMRWNAYMRVNGFSYDSHKVERALLHNKICDWGKLDDFNKKKD